MAIRGRLLSLMDWVHEVLAWAGVAALIVIASAWIGLKASTDAKAALGWVVFNLVAIGSLITAIAMRIAHLVWSGNVS